MESGELPHEVADRKRRMKRMDIHSKKNKILNDKDILALKEIVNENLNLHLDELAFLFGIQTDKYVYYITVWRCLTGTSGYSIQVQ